MVLGLECDYIQSQYFRLDDLIGRYGAWVLSFLSHRSHVMSSCPKLHDVSLVLYDNFSPSGFHILMILSRSSSH